MKKFLIIQTAFIGDVVLATSVIEKLHQFYPESSIDFLLRRGNESLLDNHPYLNKVLVWDKKEGKYNNLKQINKQVQAVKYDVLINLQRFASTGFITAFSKAKVTIGFKKNPLSFAFGHTFKHKIGNGIHEIDRNQSLIAALTDKISAKPKLYPSKEDEKNVVKFQVSKYVCLAPISVWFTKQLPKEKWVELIDNKLEKDVKVYLIGGSDDFDACEEIKRTTKNEVINLAGQLSLLESAALMKKATMNYVNDSAPLHIASAMNAPVTAFFCSTLPSYGFGPLSDNATIVEVKEKLKCRPCGLHGKKDCPKGHFKCGFGIEL